MTIRDIYTSTDDNQKLMVLDSLTHATIWAGIADNIQLDLLDRWVNNISCSGHTLLISADPE